MSANPDKKTVVLLTGLSGAGISSFLAALEDQGFETFDNLPLYLVPALLAQGDLQNTPIAFSLDSRTRGFNADAVIETFKELQKDPALNPHLVFLTCDESILHKRFSETRRRHPLAADRPVSAGIKREMDLMMKLRPAADILLDTSELSIHDLRRYVQNKFKPTSDTNSLTVSILSFGFKYGVPREADMMFDVRFMNNPHWVPDLKPLPGTDSRVVDYVRGDPVYKEFMENLVKLVMPLLPRYRHEGKSYLTIAIGCTGGHHRSVAVAEDLKERLLKAGESETVYVQHRDLERV